MAKRKSTKRASKKAAKGSGKTRKKASKKSVGRSSKAQKAPQEPGKVTPVDLSQVLRDQGLSEEQIPVVRAYINTLAESSSGGGSPPKPISNPLGSLKEDDRAKIARAGLAERKLSRAELKKLIPLGRATKINGIRGTLWQLECRLVRSLPRATFVGRAVHEQTTPNPSGSAPLCTYLDVFVVIRDRNKDLLTPQLQQKVKAAFSGSTEKGPKAKRDAEKSATSALKKNLNPRLGVLIICGYTRRQKSRAAETYVLTKRGREVFDNWPDWHEEPPRSTTGY